MGYGKGPQSKRLLYVLDPNLIYKLYIHDPKYFIKASKPLPTPGMQYLIEEGIFAHVLFMSVTKNHKMNQMKNACNEDQEYNIQNCEMNSITRQVGCRPPWDLGTYQDLQICEDVKKIQRFENLCMDIISDNLTSIVKQTKCLTPCQYNEYKFASEPDTYQTNGYQLITLKFPDNEVTIETEVELYSFISLVSDIGGALGLFLGFSFVMVWDEAEGVIRKMRKYWNDRKVKK